MGGVSQLAAGLNHVRRVGVDTRGGPDKQSHSRGRYKSKTNTKHGNFSSELDLLLFIKELDFVATLHANTIQPKMQHLENNINDAQNRLTHFVLLFILYVWIITYI